MMDRRRLSLTLSRIIVQFVILISLGSCVLMSASVLRESFDIAVLQAPVPVAIEDKHQLVYEVHLTNFSGDLLRLLTLRVVDGETHTQVLSLSGAVLAGRLHVVGLAVAGNQDISTSIAPGQRAIVYVEIDCPHGQVPHLLEHEIEYLAGKDSTPLVVTGGRITIENTAATDLGPPVGGGIWVAVHDPDWTRGHRRVIYTLNGQARIPGRFAIDWIRVDEHGRTAKGDPDTVSNWYGYGADVLAITDATVVAIRDHMAEKERVSENQKQSIEDAPGNYVVLELSDHRFAFYEHLKPGSIHVRVGDSVHRGQAIGALGFTGESTGPHLHFHVADGPTPLGAEGIPYAFEQFRLLGHYVDVEAMGSAKWQPLNPGLSASRANELPSSNAVLRFWPDGAVASQGGNRGHDNCDAHP